jgi:hypothetical protein
MQVDSIELLGKANLPYVCTRVLTAAYIALHLTFELDETAQTWGRGVASETRLGLEGKGYGMNDHR